MASKHRQYYDAKFLWLADDKAIYSYGEEDDPNFHRVRVADWEIMGKPETLYMQVDCP